MKRLGNQAFRILAALAVLGAAGAARGATENWERAYSLDGVQTVRIENVNGDVAARTWDRDYVRVTASETGSRTSLDNTMIRTSQSDGVIKIETATRHRHHFFFFWHSDHLARVDYELLLPAGTELRLETVNGSVRTQDRRGRVHAETVNGRVEIENSTGEVRGETVNGKVRVLATGEPQDMRLETVNGSIEVEVPEGSSIRYEMKSVNGRLEAGDREASGRRIVGHRLEGDFNGGRALLKAETVNGSIRLSFVKP
jgi:hypothetical protein